MKNLAIDTSNQTLAVAVTEDGKLLGQIQTTINKNHSTALMPAVEFLMNSIQMKPNELEQIVVAEGPGSYTGLRIGVTTAKTLASTLNIPLIAISSLKVLAANYTAKDTFIVPVFDARRHNVYAGVYQWREEGLVNVIADRHQSFMELIESVRPFDSVIFLGQDMDKFKAVVDEQLPQAVVASEEYMNYPSGLMLAALAKTAEPVDVVSFVPQYLKKVEAEEKWLETHIAGDDNYVEKI